MWSEFNCVCFNMMDYLSYWLVVVPYIFLMYLSDFFFFNLSVFCNSLSLLCHFIKRNLVGFFKVQIILCIPYMVSAFFFILLKKSVSIIKLERQSPMFSSYGFIDFFSLRATIHLELIFVFDVRQRSKTIFSIWISNCSSTISPIK